MRRKASAAACPSSGESAVYLRAEGEADIYGSAIVKKTLDYMTAANPPASWFNVPPSRTVTTHSLAEEVR